MTGMERNSDVVVMASYAPLFVNPDWRRLEPQRHRVRRRPLLRHASYHLQALFANNRADVVLPVESDLGADRVCQAGHDRRRHLAHPGRVQGHPRHQGR